MMVRNALFAAVTAVAAASLPAQAQMSMGGGGGKESSGVQKQYEQRQREQADIDRQYKATVRQTGHDAPKAANDPWATVRPAEQTKPKR